MNHRDLFSFPAVAAALGFAVICGCGGGKPNMAEVKGKVMVDGQPATVGTVAFIPDATRGNKGPMSSGEINTQGEFILSGGGGHRGALLGFHKVTVSCPFDAATSGSSPTGDAQPSAPSSAAPCNIPKKYQEFATTDLSAEVVAGKVNEFTFQLSSK